MVLKRGLFPLFVAVILLGQSVGFFAGTADGGALSVGQTPPAGTDRFDSHALIELQLGDIAPFTVHLQGPTSVKRGDLSRDTIPTEIVELSLAGLDPLRNLIQLREDPNLPSPGGITSVDPGGGFFPADSFFDVNVEVFAEIAGFQRWRNTQPIRVEARIDAIPPCGRTYSTPRTFRPVPLVDDRGQEVGRIIRVDHHVCQPMLFSVAPGGPSGLDPADILAPGMPPVVVIPKESLGLVSGDDIDALATGEDFLLRRFRFFPRFSVDPDSTGVPGSAVRVEATCSPAEAHGDEFGLKPFGPGDSPCVGGGPNYLCQDENGTPCGLLAPKIGLRVCDDMDALTESLPDRTSKYFFSLAPGSPTLAALGAGPADILVSSVGGTPMIYATAAALRLRRDDDIDALCLMESGDCKYNPAEDEVRFSLAPDSPSVGGAVGPADVLGPGPAVVISASELGLRSGRRGDNLNALKCRAQP